MNLKNTLDGYSSQIKKIQAEQQKRFDDLSAQISNKLTPEEQASLDALGATIGAFDDVIPDTDTAAPVGNDLAGNGDTGTGLPKGTDEVADVSNGTNNSSELDVNGEAAGAPAPTE